ncbi:YDG domain-containing protein, partial [Halopseudomonas sp. Lyrl_26]|uniref:YDG domain-containing protein n=1 Tax=Halopseudomonas sp. Lyrl_26 TaxID=3110923 RepID=UPI003F7EEEFA
DLINAVAQNRVYDGTTGADVTADLDGVISGDDLDVALSGLFEDARVGDNKTVTVSGELSGGDRGNYQLRGPVQTVASITDPVLPVGYYAAIRAPQRMPIDVPSDSLLPLTIAGKGLNLQGLAGEVVLMTTGALGNRAADQQ